VFKRYILNLKRIANLYQSEMTAIPPSNDHRRGTRDRSE